MIYVKIGFVLGYAEDVVGYKVYFPGEHTVKFVSDLRVTGNIVYRDQHDVEVAEDDLSSLHFDQDDEEQYTLSDDDMLSAFSNYEAIEDAAQATTDLD